MHLFSFEKVRESVVLLVLMNRISPATCSGGGGGGVVCTVFNV